ncbi:hypothetical protein NL108_011778, partial [Boleophthalmus pectinirostris]
KSYIGHLLGHYFKFTQSIYLPHFHSNFKSDSIAPSCGSPGEQHAVCVVLLMAWVVGLSFRFEEQQQFLKDELSKVAQKEAVIDELAKARSKEKLETRREAEKAKALVRTHTHIGIPGFKLQKKDSQLKALEAFYKAQIAQLEKRNQEEYEQSKDQFHQAASKTEEHV